MNRRSTVLCWLAAGWSATTLAAAQPDNKGFLLDWAVYTGPTSFTPGWGEWRGYTDGAGLQGQLDAVFNGQTDLDSALAAVTEHANSVLERFYPAE